MAASLRERLIAALTLCPGCAASRREENTPADGIPDGNVHESVFTCGSAVFVTDEDGLSVGRACPWPFDQVLEEVMGRVEDELEAEDAR